MELEEAGHDPSPDPTTRHLCHLGQGTEALPLSFFNCKRCTLPYKAVVMIK